MRFQLLGLVALLAGSEVALANTSQTVDCGNAVNCDPKAGPTTTIKTNIAKRDVPWLHAAVKRDVEAMDTITSLFRRDPDFEFAMSILARNAAAADKSVSQIIADIHAGTVDPIIVQAAKAKGLIKGTVKGGSKARRGLEGQAQNAGAGSKKGGSGAPGKSIGKKGAAHSPAKIAQHITSDGHIPDSILKALAESPHYKTDEKSTTGGKKPSEEQHGNGASKTGGPKGAAKNEGTKARRDAGSLFDFDFEDIFARADKKEVHLKDISKLVDKAQNDQKLADEILKDINANDKIKSHAKKLAVKYGDAEEGGDVSLDDLSSIVSAAKDDEKAKKAVMKFFNKDKVQAVTSKLIKDHVTKDKKDKKDKKGKRDAEADTDLEDFYLAAREAEAEPEFDFDEGLFVRDFDEGLFVRDFDEYSY